MNFVPGTLYRPKKETLFLNKEDCTGIIPILKKNIVLFLERKKVPYPTKYSNYEERFYFLFLNKKYWASWIVLNSDFVKHE